MRFLCNLSTQMPLRKTIDPAAVPKIILSTPKKVFPQMPIVLL